MSKQDFEYYLVDADLIKNTVKLAKNRTISDNGVFKYQHQITMHLDDKHKQYALFNLGLPVIITFDISSKMIVSIRPNK